MANKRNLATNLKVCEKNDCINNCSNEKCLVCPTCIDDYNKYQIREAFREHQHEGNFLRVFPANRYYENNELIESLTLNNKISVNWFKRKCETNKKWC